MIKSVITKYSMMVVGAMVVLVNTASATIEEDLADFSLIIGNSTSGLTGWVIAMMGVFMTPPLLYFVVMGIFVTIIAIVASLLLRRGGRR